ncbi:predicted protein [Thalassiosira pseudonana CCMP1335]|uniref:Plastid lipid-associated protein/fibrillin conserved domain-containing protein n=1 Tax=Thalassiosira pseudonana TaxID=35128 RepID=B8LBU1_THAPS|nr:predicted protein [Thalassiosira pseudonana CCMP1335]EED87107.1 predicted protein [Thalassiosira pseudonana CCMP1335]
MPALHHLATLISTLLLSSCVISPAAAFQLHTQSSPCRTTPRGTPSSSSSCRHERSAHPLSKNTQPQLPILLFASKDDNTSDVDEYRNPATQFLSKFMQSSPSTTTTNGDTTSSSAQDPLSAIDFNAPKVPKMSLQDLASILDTELYDKEWFVTGRVNPVYFDDEFQFQDPDVKLTGIEVNTTTPNTITVTWRLSGRVNIGPKGLPIKPYVCYTDFTIDERSGLIVFQEDRFDVPGWDILLSALFPFLIGKVTREAAEEVPPRVVVKREENKGGLFDGLFQKMGL